MAAEKRPASEAFGSSQLVVKRQKSNIDVGNTQAVAISDGSARRDGALVQAVSWIVRVSDFERVLNLDLREKVG